MPGNPWRRSPYARREDRDAANESLLTPLDRHFNPDTRRIDRRGDRWVLCPFHDDHHPRNFSYGPRGFKCFACEAKGSLATLAAHVGITEPLVSPVFARSPRRRTSTAAPVPPWRRDPGYLKRFELSDTAREYAYRRGLTNEAIRRFHIRSGALPNCRCGRERLILPIFEGSQLVALRGRLVPGGEQLRPCLDDCDHPKWLQARGSATVLFGAESLEPRREVFVAEAPLSVVLCHQVHPEIACVASTAGANTWRDEWAERLKDAEPSRVTVIFDNDEAGERAAPKVADSLRKLGLPVLVYHWPESAPKGKDLADLLLEEILEPVSWAA